MTRADALKLLRFYTDVFRDPPMGTTPLGGAQDSTVLTELADRFPPDGSTDEAMQWLGFAQGAAWALGIYTLEELKAHSRSPSAWVSLARCADTLGLSPPGTDPVPAGATPVWFDAPDPPCREEGCMRQGVHVEGTIVFGGEIKCVYLCCEHSGLAHGARNGPNSCGKPAVSPPCTERYCPYPGTHPTGIIMDPPHLTYRCCQHSAHVHGPGNAPWWHCPKSAEHPVAKDLRNIEHGMRSDSSERGFYDVLEEVRQRFIRGFR